MQTENTKELQALAKEGLAEVATWLEAGAPRVTLNNRVLAGFDMKLADRQTACGTVCCIYGALEQFNTQARAAFDIAYARQKYYIHPLIFPEGYSDDPSYNDTARAARVIRHFIETDTVDWSV